MNRREERIRELEDLVRSLIADTLTGDAQGHNIRWARALGIRLSGQQGSDDHVADRITGSSPAELPTPTSGVFIAAQGQQGHSNSQKEGISAMPVYRTTADILIPAGTFVNVEPPANRFYATAYASVPIDVPTGSVEGAEWLLDLSQAIADGTVEEVPPEEGDPPSSATTT